MPGSSSPPLTSLMKVAPAAIADGAPPCPRRADPPATLWVLILRVHVSCDHKVGLSFHRGGHPFLPRVTAGSGSGEGCGWHVVPRGFECRSDPKPLAAAIASRSQCTKPWMSQHKNSGPTAVVIWIPSAGGTAARAFHWQEPSGKCVTISRWWGELPRAQPPPQDCGMCPR